MRIEEFLEYAAAVCITAGKKERPTIHSVWSYDKNGNVILKFFAVCDNRRTSNFDTAEEAIESVIAELVNELEVQKVDMIRKLDAHVDLLRRVESVRANKRPFVMDLSYVC